MILSWPVSARVQIRQYALSPVRSWETSVFSLPCLRVFSYSLRSFHIPGIPRAATGRRQVLLDTSAPQINVFVKSIHSTDRYTWIPPCSLVVRRQPGNQTPMSADLVLALRTSLCSSPWNSQTLNSQLKHSAPGFIFLVSSACAVRLK